VTVSDLDGYLRQQLGVAKDFEGALVTSIDPDSNAADAGLRRGDVIVEINQHPVASASDAVKLGRQAKGGQILLKIWRHAGDLSGTSFLSVDNTKKGK
jgi:serine protease Do